MLVRLSVTANVQTTLWGTKVAVKLVPHASKPPGLTPLYCGRSFFCATGLAVHRAIHVLPRGDGSLRQQQAVRLAEARLVEAR